jgi:hypothetical protein
MWIIDRVKNDQDSHNSARCFDCGYRINIDIFTRENLKMIMEAHKCREEY